MTPKQTLTKQNLIPEKQLIPIPHIFHDILVRWSSLLIRWSGTSGNMRHQIPKNKIHLDDARPFKDPSRNIPLGMYQQIREHLKVMAAILDL